MQLAQPCFMAFVRGMDESETKDSLKSEKRRAACTWKRWKHFFLVITVNQPFFVKNII